MRDPMSWALRVFTAYGIPVKVHLFFFIFTIGMFLRQVTPKDNPIWWVDVFLFIIVILFGIILVHEFGHCFAVRSVGGEARDILIWPLGGLATLEVPYNPRALFITTAGGPGVNVLICLLCTAGLATGGFWPSLNPIATPYIAEMHNFRDGRDYTDVYGLKLYKPGTAEPIAAQAFIDALVKSQNEGLREKRVFSPETAENIASGSGGERALAPPWAVWVNRIFWMSWLLLLFNLLPAYPLDGGQLLQAVIWARTDYRRGVVVAAYSGFVVAILFLIVSIWQNEALFMGLSLFMLYMSSVKLFQLEA